MRTYPLAYCPPGRGFTMSYIRGRCPRLLIVVPSRHRSAGGVQSVAGLSQGQGFILVYRLAIDAKTLWGDGEAD